MLRLTERGLYCQAGDFHIDPWLPVDRAMITHAHGDHARWGSKSYLCSVDGAGVLHTRMGPGAAISTLSYGETIALNGVRVSLPPAGHILGSAQVRVEHGGEVWVVSGDYKTQPDSTQSLRLPCFFVGARTTVLPAFGDFTGLGDIEPEATDRIFVVAKDEVVRVETTSAMRDDCESSKTLPTTPPSR